MLARDGTLVVMLLLLATPAGRLSGQESAAAFWRALKAADTPGEVVDARVPVGVDPDLVAGMRYGRLYEFSNDRTDAYRGRELLQRAVARDRDNAWAQFALGALLVRGPDARMRPFAERDDFFISPYSLGYIQGTRALKQALVLDPQLAAAAIELLHIALERSDAALAREAQAALARMPRTGEVALWRARAALLRDQPDSAVAMSRVARAGRADQSLAWHTEAAALLLDRAQQSAGRAAYFEGAARLTEAGARDYFRALAAIADEADRAAWARTPLPRKGAWLQQFWEYHAGLAGVTLAQRLGEHYRRLQWARQDYQLDAPLVQGAEMSAVTLGIDPRRFGLTVPGLMVVRHGDPYRLALLRHCQFGVAQLVKSQRATASFLAALVPPGAVHGADEELVATELPGDMRLVCRPTGGDEVLRGQLLGRLLRQLVARDSYEPPFERHLSFAAALYAFRGSGDSTQILAAVSLPLGGVRALANPDGSLATRLSLVLVQDSSHRVQRTDRLDYRRLPPALLAPGASDRLTLLQAELQTSLKQHVRYRIALTDTTGEQTGAIVGGELDVPEFTGPGPQLSDMVFAPTDARGAWRRGDVALSPAPGRTFRAGEPVHLFYELYHVAEAEPYRTHILMAPHSDGFWRGLRQLVAGERNVAQVQFEESARSPHPQYGLQELRTVGTADLAPGVYRLQVRVTNQRTGESTARERLLEIGR